MSDLPRFYVNDESLVRPERRAREQEKNRVIFKLCAMVAVLAVALAVQHFRANEREQALKAEHAQELAACRNRLGMVTPQRDPGHCWDYNVHMEGWDVQLCAKTIYRM